MKEVWKDIPGFEGRYQASSTGKIVSLIGRKKLLYPSPDKNGYKRVNLWKDGKGHCLYIHRVIASLFVPNPEGYPEVNHKDEDKGNNSADNLEWCSVKYNRAYGTRGKRISETLKRNAERRKNAQEH